MCLLGLLSERLSGTSPLPDGASTVNVDFACDGSRGGGTLNLSADGKSVGSGRIEKTQPNIYCADETAGVGVDMETPVSDDSTLESSKFSGSIHEVTINTKPSN